MDIGQKDKIGELQLLLNDYKQRYEQLNELVKQAGIKKWDKMHCPACGKLKPVLHHEKTTRYHHYYTLDCCTNWKIWKRSNRGRRTK